MSGLKFGSVRESMRGRQREQYAEKEELYSCMRDNESVKAASCFSVKNVKLEIGADTKPNAYQLQASSSS